MKKALAYLAAGLLWSSSWAQVPPKPAAVAHGSGAKFSRQITTVGEDVKIIREESLAYDPTLNANPSHVIPAFDQKDEIIDTSPTDQSALNGGVDSGPTLMDAQEINTKGLRQYLFTLKPKEAIKFRLSGAPLGKMNLMYAIPELRGKDPLFSELHFQNQRPLRLRQTGMEFRNSLDTPYRLVLVVLGWVRIPYTLSIERKGALLQEPGLQR